MTNEIKNFPDVRRLYMENYQSISGPVEIEFRKITLLYGPNSAGKSAILDALKIIERITNTENPINRQEILDHKRKHSFSMSVGVELFIDDSDLLDTEIPVDLDPIVQELSDGTHITIHFSFSGVSDKLQLCVGKHSLLFEIENKINVNQQFWEAHNPGKVWISDYPGLQPETIEPEASEIEFFREREKFDEFTSYEHYLEEHDEYKAGREGNLIRRAGGEVEGEIKLNTKHNLSKCLMSDIDKINDKRQVFLICDDVNCQITRGITWSIDDVSTEHYITVGKNNLYFFFPPEKYKSALKCDGIHDYNSAYLFNAFQNISSKYNSLISWLFKIINRKMNISIVYGTRQIINSSIPIHISSNNYYKMVDYWVESDKGDHIAHSAIDSHKNTQDKNQSHSRINASGRVLSPNTETRLYSGPRNISYDSFIGNYTTFVSPLSGYAIQCADRLVIDDNDESVKSFDFPNYVFEKILLSMSNYRIVSEVYALISDLHVMDDDSFLSESKLVYFVLNKTTPVSTDHRLNFSDVGSGLSFVFPILTSLNSFPLTYVEQPELHLHPRAQNELADVFIIAASRGNLSILESHSEQLLLKISERIEATNRKKHSSNNLALTIPELELKASDISVYYFQPNDHEDTGTEVHSIQFSTDGTVIDDWPDGFFSEGEITTFSRMKLFSSLIKQNISLEKWPWLLKQKKYCYIYPWMDTIHFTISTKENYSVLLPLFSSKIAEKLLSEILLKPFQDEPLLKNIPHFSKYSEVYRYLVSGIKPPSLGQFVYLLEATSKNYRSNDDKLVISFRNYLKNLSWSKSVLLRDEAFITSLKKLSILRNRGAHIDDPTFEEANSIEHLIVEKDQRGSIFLALGI